MDDTQVRTYSTSESMDTGVAEMAQQGYRVQEQSGEFPATVTVTFVRDEAGEQAQEDVDAATVLLLFNG